MEILYLLVPLSVVAAFLIGACFGWAVRSGQFDDLDGPAHRILMDDDTPGPHAAADEAAGPCGGSRAAAVAQPGGR
jgi:cbb3-type cytochrome oxidase maturation protein